MVFESLEMSIAGPFPEGEGEVRWVTAEWLMEHIDDGMRIIDCQPNVHDFIRGHIPGSVYLAEESMRLSQRGTPHVWLPPKMAEIIFRAVGVNNKRSVLVYTSTNPHLPTGDGVPQGMLAYSLAKYGHKKILQLDGGLDAWVQIRGQLETRYSKIGKGDFLARSRKDLMIDYDEFLTVMDLDQVVHIDSRPAAQYLGRSSWPKEGHIPGAINIPWSELYAPDDLTRLRPKEELMEILSERGVTIDKKIICHCGSGRKAAAQLCVMRWFLDFPNVRLFEGSYTEWCAKGGY
jgi:thiosulfate/3-mercaptopyruvate sulfurtransferase